jgi:hypothetical protein
VRFQRGVNAKRTPLIVAMCRQGRGWSPKNDCVNRIDGFSGFMKSVAASVSEWTSFGALSLPYAFFKRKTRRREASRA